MRLDSGALSRFFVVSLIAMLVTSHPADAQQISPNPNPVGNLIHVVGTKSNDLGVHFENMGDILIGVETFAGDATLNNFGTLENNGTVTNYEVLDNQSVVDNNGDYWDFGKLNNNGTFTNNSFFYTAARLNNFDTFINYAYFENAGAILTNNGLISNHDEFYSVGNLHNHGTIENDGLFEIYEDVFNYNTFTNSNNLLNYYIIENSGDLTNSGSFTNYYELNNTGTVTNSGTLNNTGTIDTSLGSFINSGTLSGDGVFIGDIYDEGIMAPGNSPSVLSIQGDWFKTDGSVDIELGGTFDGGGNLSLTEFDWIDVSGDVELAGTLDVELINGFQLQYLMSFVIVPVGGEFSGQFDGLSEGEKVGRFGGKNLYISYAGGDGNDVALFTWASSIPEPNSLALVGVILSLCAVGRMRRRRLPI